MSPTHGKAAIQAGAGAPTRLASMTQRTNTVASRTAKCKARPMGTTSTATTTTSARLAATVVLPLQARTSRAYSGQLAKPMISAASTGTTKPRKK